MSSCIDVRFNLSFFHLNSKFIWKNKRLDRTLTHIRLSRFFSDPFIFLNLLNNSNHSYGTKIRPRAPIDFHRQYLPSVSLAFSNNNGTHGRSLQFTNIRQNYNFPRGKKYRTKLQWPVFRKENYSSSAFIREKKKNRNRVKQQSLSKIGSRVPQILSLSLSLFTAQNKLWNQTRSVSVSGS